MGEVVMRVVMRGSGGGGWMRKGFVMAAKPNITQQQQA
jgi:hypothetical protein